MTVHNLFDRKHVGGSIRSAVGGELRYIPAAEYQPIAAISFKNEHPLSLKDAWADTTTPHGRLMLAVLGGLAEFERELIRARTGEGRKRAKTRGVKFGRPPKLTPHQRQEALARLSAGETQADIARTCAVDTTTIGRLQ